jgi:hypothetical protein
MDITDVDEGEFHEAMRVSIPPLVQLLKHWDHNLRLVAVSALENLTKHGELQ